MASYGVSASRVDKYGIYQTRNRSTMNRSTAQTAWNTQNTLGQNVFSVTVASSASAVTTSLSQISLAQKQSSVATAIKQLLAVDLTV
ncbi:hypothetical protein [Methylobrevis albus]|uniref:Uncharacterized protein n=1 Tax=Methylobrevis albus TaxID=2793297 RepID=A0A931MZ10_9HYPH|nr:hypothetical protein [Methylobrevis albus]MBH0238555.1 hypothetical protein [Methylobrevis albus]